MAQNVLKIHDRGVEINLVLTDEAYIQVNGTLIFGQPKQGTIFGPTKIVLTRREAHEKTGIGTKAHQEAEKYVTEFEAKFDKEFLTRYWNIVMQNLHFRNVVFRSDYYKMLPQDKPVDAMVQSTKKFLINGICEQNQENVAAIRNMFSVYMDNCDKFYTTGSTPQTKTIITKPKATTDWTSRAKEVNETK